MKKLVIFLILAPALAAALSGWKEYPAGIPVGFKFVYDVTVNASASGYAFVNDGTDPGKQYVLKLQNGVWSPSVAPPDSLAFPSISPNGTIYAVSNGMSPEIYRFEGTYWKSVAAPERFGMHGFFKVAAVGPHEFWALGSTVNGYAKVLYFQNDQPARIFELGQLGEPNYSISGKMAVPRQAAPNGDCYVAVNTRVNPYNAHKWLLFVLRPDGDTRAYGFPLDNYYCDGLAAYNPGDVRVMLTANTGAESRLYGFTAGVFREICVFPERVALDSYPTPSDGWGHHYPNRIYHWSGGAVAPATDISNTEILDLSMAGAMDGWAAGCKIINGERTAMLWHYSDLEPAITPASLGRVKATFR